MRSCAWSRRMKLSSSRGSRRTQIGGGSSPVTRAARSARPPSEYGVLDARHPQPPAGSGMALTLASPLAMTSYLRRLLRAGAAYQLADAVSKVVALALLPIYSRYLTPADYGTAELMLTTIILVSIVLRLGLGEAFVRFHFLDADAARRRHLARTATGTLLAITTVAALLVAIFAGPVSRALLGSEQPDVVRAAALGLWAFTNLELAYALLRVEERAKAFATASLINVALTVILTVWLVVL